MRFSDFLLVSDPADLDFIVGYAGDQNIRIDVADFVADYISGSGTPGYVPVFTAADVIGDSVVFQHGTNIVIGGVNSLGYKLAVSGSLYASNGAVINSTVSGADALRVIGGDGDIFVIPNDLGQPISSLRRINHPPAILTTESATLGQLNTAISNLEGDIEILLNLKVDKTSVGVPNGVASLDAGGKVPLSQIPDSIIGQVQYMGTWNALTNTPTLNFLVPEEKGHYYVVSVAGVFGGIDFQVGDWIISNGTYWEKVDNTDAVTSVFGRIGAILALEADYQSFYPRLSQAYDNPTWINTLAFSKITGVPPFLLENQTITLSGDVTGSGKTSISTTISDNAVTDSKLRNSVGTSVIGRASSTTGDPADIQATTDGHVLLRSGGNLLFGLISSDSIGSIDWSKITNTPTTLSGYGITNAYTKTEADNKFVPYTGANANVNLGSNNITANSFIKAGGTSAQFLKADGSVDTSQYVPTTRSINAGTGLTGGGNLSSDVNIAFDTTWGDTRYAYRTREIIAGTGLTGGGDLSANRTLSFDTTWGDIRYAYRTREIIAGLGMLGGGDLSANRTLNFDTAWGDARYLAPLAGYVPLSRQITINGTTFDLSIDRSYSVGTVTSIGLSVPVGFDVSNSPITSSGDIVLSFDPDYSLPTNAKQLEWDTAYNNRITSITTTGTSGAATLVSHILNIPQYQAQGNYITSLTGEATASGPGSASVTLVNSAVTGKVLTGLTVTGSSILSTDSILTAFGKLQGQVNDLIGGLRYEGTWNASTNTPTITSGVGTDGEFYIVSVAGTTNIDGINDWQIGDWIVFHDTAWQKVDNTESVVSVNGLVGAVTLTTSNISEGTNLYFTNGRARTAISLTTTGNNGASTYNNTTGVFNIPQYTLTGLGGVPTTRSITINGTNFDLSADRSWTVGDVRTDSSYANPVWITSLAWSKITGTPTTLSGYGITNAYTQAQVDSLLSGYVTLGTDQTITGLKTIVRSGDVLNFKIGTDTLYGLKLFYSQNELVPSGEATWSFVNTFNRNGVGYETTPISFFRGVLVTGERLLSASINSNLLDYYGNNPSGRYPVYAYNTGVQQFSTGIIVGKTTGVVNAGTGAIADLPAGVVANFNGRVIGGNAVNSNEFVTLSQVSGYVPTSRTITINGTTQDLSANRTFNVGTVTSVTASSPLASSGGTTPNITISQSSGSTNGFLSSTDWTTFNNKANANGSNASGTWGISITGNAATASNSTQWDGYSLPTWTNWSSRGSVAIVVGQLAWKNYGNNHVIFDASNSTSPTGSGVNSTNPDVAWSATYPTLMGWNGSSTYGVRVDSARRADNVEGFGAGAFYRNLGFGSGFPSWDLNTVPEDRSGFTYSNNAPYTGPFIHIGASGYGLQFNAPYGGAGYGLTFRTKNGDNGTWNPWQYPAVYGINVNGGGSLYATIYYDQSNTAYYVDAASTSNIYRLTMNERITLGVFPNSTTNTGEAWIGRAADRNAGTMTVQLGGNSPSSRQFEVVDYAWSVVLFSTTSDGNSFASSSFRAPIFYDSNDTGFYIDPNSFSRLSRLAVGGGANDVSGININGDAAITSSNSFYFGHTNGSLGSWQTRTFASGGRQIWNTNGFEVNRDGYGGGWSMSINSSGSATFNSSDAVPININGAANKYLTINPGNGYEAMVRYIGGSGSGWYVGKRTSGQLVGSESFHFFSEAVGATVGGVTPSGQIHASGDMRAPIFYDSNNTAFYLDPNSTGISSNNAGGAVFRNIQISSASFTDTIQNVSSGGNIWLNYGHNGPVGLGYGGGLTTAYASLAVNGTSSATGNMRAPIFYDSNDTTYYVDPASGTNLYSTFQVSGSHSDSQIGVRLLASNNGAGTGEVNLRMWCSEPGVTWAWAGFGYNVTNNNGSPGGFGRLNTNFGQAYMRFSTDGELYFYNTNTGGTRNQSLYLGSSGAAVFGNTVQTGSVWINNGNNFNSYDENIRLFNAPNGVSVIAFSATGVSGMPTTSILGYSDRMEFRYGNGAQYRIYNGYTESMGSSRAPIFYDSNNTGFFVDPASGSNLNWLTINDWYYVNGALGMYWNSYARGFVAPEQQGNPYGNITTYGTGRNGWSGYGIGSTWAFMSTSSSNVGIHDNSYGWRYYWNGSFHQFGGGYLQADGSMRSPIFYDSANTAYYLDPSGGSYLASSVEVANGYFLTNGIGGAMYMTSVSGSFGGYLRTSGHMVLDQMNAGYNVYVLDGNSVGVVKNAGSQSWSAFSDATIKTVHSTMEDNLSKLQSITPIYYSFNNFADDKNRIGLIAQEVQEHFPELVEVEPRTEKLTLDYTGLIPVLLGAIKELKTEIETLKTQL